MTEEKRPLKVFLCHAHSDKDQVRELYLRLKKDGVDAWLDKEKLLPGQDWELEIRKAVREADVVVVCLSKQFNQAGFRQKEVRLALDTAMEQPEGEIFIIPARLEECDNLESLRKWHWVDLFEGDGYERLMRALRARADKIGTTLQVKKSWLPQNTSSRSNIKKTLPEKAEREGISKKNPKIQLVEYNQPKENTNQQQVSIYVINNGDEDLTDCVGTLVSMTYYWQDGGSTNYKDVVVLPRQLAWSSKTRPNDSHLVTIKPGKNQAAILDVARANNGEMIFTFVTGDDPNHRMIGSYELTVEIAGKINGHLFQSVENRFRLDFRGGDVLFVARIVNEKYEVHELSTSGFHTNMGKPTEAEPKSNTKFTLPKTRSKFKTEYIVAIISAVATIIAGLLSSPLIERWLSPIPVATELATATFTVTTQPITPSQIVQPIQASQTPTLIYAPTDVGILTPIPLPTEITDAEGVSMVLVPEGGFSMGSNDDFSNEKPIHFVKLDSYYIDKYEVANRLYNLCVKDGVCLPPAKRSSYSRESYFGNSLYDGYPVIYVTWEMAKTYCEWRGARLPSESEWEKSARGTGGRIYPWGDTMEDVKINYNGLVGDTEPVGSHASGISPYGSLDMAGNVQEWVSDWYQSDYYSINPTMMPNPLGPLTGIERVVRGGSWDAGKNFVRTSYRNKSSPASSYYNIGFRCAMNATP